MESEWHGTDILATGKKNSSAKTVFFFFLCGFVFSVSVRPHKTQRAMEDDWRELDFDPGLLALCDKDIEVIDIGLCLFVCPALQLVRVCVCCGLRTDVQTM